jgi:hypothetical protein
MNTQLQAADRIITLDENEFIRDFVDALAARLDPSCKDFFRAIFADVHRSMALSFRADLEAKGKVTICDGGHAAIEGIVAGYALRIACEESDDRRHPGSRAEGRPYNSSDDYFLSQTARIYHVLGGTVAVPSSKPGPFMRFVEHLWTAVPPWARRGRDASAILRRAREPEMRRGLKNLVRDVPRKVAGRNYWQDRADALKDAVRSARQAGEREDAVSLDYDSVTDVLRRLGIGILKVKRGPETPL